MFKITVPKFIKSWFSDKARERMRQIEGDIYWYLSGMPNPPVSSYKRKMIKKLAKGTSAKVFIESGTFGGDTVDAMKKHFNYIYSIELDNELSKKAQERFKHVSNVEILNGDSGVVIPRILEKISEPVVFWLDGHYSGDGTAKTTVETPIAQELESIFGHWIKGHLILIDDARCFNGTSGYPTIEDLRKIIKEEVSDLTLMIKHDVIIIR